MDDTDYDALAEIGEKVYEYAQTIFENAGCIEDFCIQTIGSSVVVFGGFNRLLWSPEHGFSIDRGYCTENFKKSFTSIIHGIK